MVGDDGAAEALRRGLYRSGATEGDVERYLAARPATAPQTTPGTTSGTAPAAAEAPTASAKARRRRPVVLAAVGVLLVAGVAVATALSAPGSGRTPTLDPSPVADQVLTPYGALVPVPTPAAVSVEGEGAAGHLYRGRGDSRFPLDLDGASSTGGRVVIDVRASGGARWVASRVSASAAVPELRFASGRARPDDEPILVLPYEGAPPVLLAIEADADQPWTAVVAFLPAESATLR